MRRSLALTHLRSIASISMLALTLTSTAAHGQADPAGSARAQDADRPAAVDPRWVDRLDKLDRELLDENLGFAPHAFTDELRWIGTPKVTWEQLRGKVVVVQSWTTATSPGRRVPDQLQAMFGEMSQDDVRLFALHTPEGADNIDRYLERRAVEVPILIDARGRFCDELGMYKRPTNLVIDRHGTVRYAGLRLNALADAVALLMAEPFDPDDATRAPKQRPAAEATSNTTFPEFSGGVGAATDVRGQRAPDFHVERWLNGQPEGQRDKVIVVDFWATWCGPCIATIPHMNELADRFRDDVLCIGLSDESQADFARGMQRLNRDRDITMQSFRYALALDNKGRMKNALSVRGIPHVIVISSDWIVRWQGHPANLREEIVEQIVEANRALVHSPDHSRRYRFSG